MNGADVEAEPDVLGLRVVRHREPVNVMQEIAVK